MEGHMILLRFWVLLYKIDESSTLKYCIFTKLLQILCVLLVYTFWYVKIPNVTADYGSFSDLFDDVDFIKLLQIGR